MTRAARPPQVVIAQDGPYLVSGNVPLVRQTIETDAAGGSDRWREGERYGTGDSYALCRCGQSRTKPFCDGSHVAARFRGAETASREPFATQAKVHDGPTMALKDREELCAFARFCDPNGQVWNQVRHTDSPGTLRTFERQVGNCPSGRLVAWNKRTGTATEPALPISIGVVEDPPRQCGGPLWLRGGIPVVGSDGFAYEVRNRVTLCRCGQSQNKPFCDGTHAQVRFKGD